MSLCDRYDPIRCKAAAVFDVLDPDGVARLRYCQFHGRHLCREYADKLGEAWTLREITTDGQNLTEPAADTGALQTSLGGDERSNESAAGRSVYPEDHE